MLAGTLTSADRSRARFTAPTGLQSDVVYRFRLTVTDSAGQTGTAETTVKVKGTPTVELTDEIIYLEVDEGDEVTLSGRGSGYPGEGLSYLWSYERLDGAPDLTDLLPDLAAARITFTAPSGLGNDHARYRFTLTVTDEHGASASKSVNLLVKTPNPRPTADAGPDGLGSWNSRSPTTLDGSGSRVPCARNEPGGCELYYQWRQLFGTSQNFMSSRFDAANKRLVPGTRVELGNAELAKAFFIAPAGPDETFTGIGPVYEQMVFMLTVADAQGNTDSDCMTVRVGAPRPSPDQGCPGEGESAPPSGTAGPDSGEAQASGQGAASSCIVEVGQLAGSIELSGAWDAADFRAHHRVDRPALYFRFTLPEETEVSLGLVSEDAPLLFVSRGTPQNGWGAPPAGRLEHRLNARRNNGKLLHEEGLQATLTLPAGEYTAEAVSDRENVGGTSGSFTLALAAPSLNTAPVIYHIPPVRAFEGNPVRLIGLAADSHPAEALSFLWEQTGGTPTVTLADANTDAASFTAPDVTEDTDLTFRLTVTDSGGLTDRRDVTVTILPGPGACAGPDLAAAPGDTVTLDGACSVNPNGEAPQLAHAWTQLSGPAATLSDAAAGNPSFTVPGDAANGATLEFRLTVTLTTADGSASDSDTVTVTVEKPQPVANAGPDLAAAPGESVVLKGVGSENPYGEWWQMEYRWTQLSGPTVTLSDATVGDPSLTVPEDAADGATLEFELTVTDREGESDSDTVIVTVNRPSPTANAGPDQAAPPDATVTLQGAGSVNPYGKWWHLEYRWIQLSGPEVTISDQTEPEPTFTMPEDAADGTTLEFQLTVTDRYGQTDSDTVTFTVEASAALRPTACAGPDLTGAPGDSVTLQGTCSENPYGRWWKLAHSWTQLSGPTVTLDQPTHGNPSFTLPEDAAGGTTLEFELTVTDKEGQSDSDSMIVTVQRPTDPEANTPPTFDEGDSAIRSLAENSEAGTHVGLPLSATDPDGDTLTYTLSGADSGSFEIDAATGQLTTKEGVSYDYEAKQTYAVSVTAEDPEGATASISVTINLTDANDPPVFDEGTSATRSLAENTAAGENVGLPLTATDPDGDTLTYTLSGADAGSFDLNAATGQLTTKEGVSYDYETKSTYAVTVTAEDPEGASAFIDVTVNLVESQEAAVNNAPVFDAGSSAVFNLSENSPAGQNVGEPLSATDPDDDTLTYSLSGADAGSFDLNAATAQLTTGEGVTYDYEEKATYSVTITAEDGNDGTAAIDVTVNLTDVNEPPAFDDGTDTTREVAENSGEGQPVGAPVTATDPDGNTLAYTLSGDDAGSFEIDADTGQLLTVADVTYDYGEKATYSVTVEVSDGAEGTATIAVTVNLTEVDESEGQDGNSAPVFDEGERATRSLAEDSAAGENVGAPLTATDPDDDTLTYSLSGDDADSFNILQSTGQLQTKRGVTYDYETKPTYSLTVEATDPEGANASISVTVSLTDANDPPAFDEGDNTIRSLAENTAAGENVGLPLAATDQDGDTLAYTLSGDDAGSFEIDADTGQLLTKEGVAYDYEAKSAYTVTVAAEDPEGSSASISVTVNLTDVEETLPVTDCFTDPDTLTAAVEYSGDWNGPDCDAHHRDGPARYFHFSLERETKVEISLESEADAQLFVSEGTPRNGWGTLPNGSYEDRRRIRRDNEKLVHDGAHAGPNSVTLMLDAGEYTTAAAGPSGGESFTPSIASR